jgi:adenylosuccinate synthase
VIVDLGFGDAGKGLLTDSLVRRTGARIVVRYNGGAQAGHNVVTPDGRHHTFSQFGAGSFVPAVRTFLSRDVVVHPTALLREEAHLREVGVMDAMERIRISGNALVITPYHQALNRLREAARGRERHGSCGVGVGEAVAHGRTSPEDAICVRDLTDLGKLRRKLRRIREQAWSEVIELAGCGFEQEAEVFRQPTASEQWIERAGIVGRLAADDDAWMPRTDEGPAVIFEGAQGVLLDEWHGFHPYTTWSTCTSALAARLLSEHAPGAEVSTIGVLRTYGVRHGPGPFPTETADLAGTPAEHNSVNPWQGAVRRGWFDGVLARYAVAADGCIDALAVTHLDWLPHLARWTYCESYGPDPVLVPSAARSLDHQERLTARLAEARPVLRNCGAGEEDVLSTIEEIVEKPVAIGSRGPTAADVFMRPGLAEVRRGLDRHREVG